MIAEVGEVLQRNFILVLVLTGLFSLLAGVLFANQKNKNVCEEVSYSATSAPDGIGQADESVQASEITVDLSGAVKNPGVYMMNPEARVVDLIKLGDGFTNDVSAKWVSKNLNLSAKMKDSQKIYVPFEWEIEYKSDNSIELLNDDIMDYEEAVDFINQESTPSYSEDTSVQYNSSLVNVNSATEGGLDTLPGIGKAYAQKIILNRPYAGFEELKNKSGIPVSTLEKIKSSITF
ncbi:hypothetical protein A3F07_04500 [candidate division WWE3 bacterium RIFCSPHIGHO2_12_FULL_38_15]|uniref:Soluble ligand binding domain-containing protein n=1 Tax=candidate division WWE3 bacterium RIFCSPHIGHO2_02_FULL_38_14 TaxID=1802620 RepID=A0A1F4VC22_UNCKA|nr:MAG: hypothetical protein A3F07_04500 [candidate division WWE3 bacterium RIFCSPHIGHO2_12_FULL_38_15]OGC54621.1 MAG: hypothetical protein A3B64_03115 [candidate division WWE3 bacterium RIFCSPLOWO2_01_FULL_37_24]OGC54669.1 MAG: hypothetical protein A3D91_03610 [candidate division WWE3 bacterium RIFCSPHIGHO2_02_FULL_38_14]HLB51363.1 helix-hairpin-helix domain-containing protein [Patescibacteria group bacterium]